MRSFEGFQRKAVVIVPTDEDFKSRVDKQTKDEGREIPDIAVYEMKGTCGKWRYADVFGPPLQSFVAICCLATYVTCSDGPVSTLLFFS